MKQTLQLLSTPDKRPINEAIVWYKDGLQLMRKQLGGWAAYMVTSILLLLTVVTAIDLVIALIVQVIPAFASVGLLILIISSSWVVLSLQCGLYRSMARIINGNKVSIEDLFWGFRQLKNQQFWFFIFFVSLLNLAFQWVEGQLIGEIYRFDPNSGGQLYINDEKIALFVGLNTIYWLFLSMLTWAVLPIMTEFSQQTFADTIKRNLYGTLNNFIALMYLGALMTLTMFIFAMIVVTLASVVSQLIGLVCLFLMVFWGVPLFNSWQYAAYRHIFTNW